MHILKQLKKQQPLVFELFYKLFDLHEGEERRAFFMWLYIFLIISALMIVKPMVNALFLSSFGAEKLPQVFILVAILAAFFAVLYSNLLKTNNLRRLITLTLNVVIAIFFVFWILVTFNWLEGGALYMLYIFVAVFAIISSSQFWIMANVIFNAREAKRLFGFIGSGAIAGGIFGGYLTTFLAPLIRSENLILVFILFLIICLKIIKKLWQEKNTAEKSAYLKPVNNNQQKQKPWHLIRSSRHLSLLAALVGIGVLVGKLVEFQFSAIASEKITDPDKLTAFFGFWLSSLNIVTLFIQLLLTRRIVGVFGVGTSLFFLPAAILFGAIAILFFPELWAAVLIKMCDGSFKNSINKSGMELLALPIAIDIRTQAKSFIDIFVDSFATGIGGILLFALTGILNASVQQVSFLSIVLISFWIYLIALIRREYVRSFRLKIETVESREMQKELDLSNETVISGFSKVLSEGTEKQIMQVLRMLRNVQNMRLTDSLGKLINHKSNVVRLEVLRQLYFYRKVDLSYSIRPLLHDENLDIRSEALQYIYQKSSENRNELLNKYLDDGNYYLRSAAIICAARESRGNQTLKEHFKIGERIENELGSVKNISDKLEVITIKRCCARAIGQARLQHLLPFLNYMLHDPEPDVVRAAIIGAGLSGEKEFGPILIQLLKEPIYWTFSQTALVNFGVNIIDILSNHLKNPYVDLQARLNIPKVLAKIELQDSVNTLFRNINIKDRAIRNEIIHALFHLRQKAAHLRFDEPVIMDLIFEEANDYLYTLTFLYNQIRLEKHAKPTTVEDQIQEARRLLIDALEKRLDRKLNRIFQMLGLKYPPKDIQSAYAGISSSDAELRLNAVEFLDNLLDTDLKKIIIPIAESTMLDEVVAKSLKSLGMKTDRDEIYLEGILNSDDVILRFRTLVLIGHMNQRKYLPHIAKCLDDADDKIRALAKKILESFGL